MAVTQVGQKGESPWAKALAVLALAGTLVLISALMSASLQAQGSTEGGNLDNSPANGGWFFKAGGWIDYAPNGVPDFDQKQDGWAPGGTPPPWTYCGPAAVANSLWWFDSKFEPFPQRLFPLPSTLNDHYYLVTSYNPGADDHDPLNVGGMGLPGLIDELAWYFDTDGQRTQPGVFPWTGTEVHTMTYGLQWYLYGGNPAWGPSPYQPYPQYRYYDDYHVQLVKMPTWDWVVEEVERSEDVILLLGFWQLDGDYWRRVGGHYVTVAGIRGSPPAIAFSDPFIDNAELGGWGRVLSGTLVPHQPQPHPDPTLHNDAGNISHDYYTVTLTPTSPAGLWEIEGYAYDPNFEFQNCPKEYRLEQGPPTGSPVTVEVEYALAMSPFYWKPGGEWVDTWWQNDWITEFWRYEDDGDSCLPDFTWIISGAYPYDGPVVAANSFWWFDSKAETLKTGGFPTPPPTISDHYDLVTSYSPGIDDHDVANIVFLIMDLVNYLGTDPQGTTAVSMTAGIDAFLARPGVANDFYTETQVAPTWEWIADEVETSEDVILLLGFYEQLDSGTWERKGGHWVNAAGVSRDSRLLGLSDPAIDHANHESISNTLYLGRVFPPEQLGTPFPSVSRGPQQISHDIYSVYTSTNLSKLALSGYPFTHTSVLSNYVGLNGGGTPVADWGHPFLTLVDWAIGVSPYSDLIITKTASSTQVEAGDWVTFTIRYTNTGLAAVEGLTITDMLPTGVLTNIQVASWPPISVSLGLPLTWTRPRLSYGQTGTLTITAQALLKTTLTNTVYITGSTRIGQPTPDRDPSNNIAKIELPCTALTGITIAGASEGRPGLYTFTTTYEPTDATPPLTYLWDNGDTTPDSSRALDAGSHTLTVTATNCTAALVTDTHTIVITAPKSCIETQMVELTLVSPAPVPVGSSAQFEADISPDDADKSYLYLLTLDGVPGLVQASSADPLTFTHTFTTTGNHILEIAVWNCTQSASEAVSDTLTVEVVPYRLYLPLLMRDR